LNNELTSYETIVTKITEKMKWQKKGISVEKRQQNHHIHTLSFL